MATGPVSLPRDNALAALRVIVEEKKGEVTRNFLELTTALKTSEDTVTKKLDEIYIDTRESVESNERTVTQLEQSKIAFQATLVDNKMNLFLQNTIQSIDGQIAEVRNSTTVPKQIYLRWRNEDVKQSIHKVCDVISSPAANVVEGPTIQSIQVKDTREIETLKTSHAIEKEEFLKREEKHKQTITQLKGRIADKDREISFREEKLKNLEEEMGRFSEESHQIFDKYSEDKSKYDESETHLEEMRKELLKHKHMFTVLEKEKHQLEETNNALITQGEEFQNVISSLKSEREDLHNQCSMMRQQQQQIVTDSTRTDEEILSLKQQIKQLKDIIAVKDNVIQKFSDSEVVTLQKKYSELERELRHLKDTTNPPNITHEERISGTTGRKIVSLEEKIGELEIDLTLKTSECDDLKREVVSLKSELKEAQDILASKLERSEDLAGLSVSQSLGADFNRKDYTYYTQQSTDAELIRNLRTQVKEYQTQISDQSADISYLQKLKEEKFTENNILRTNLDDTLKELKTKLHLKHTEENLSVTQSYLNKEQNPTKVQPKIETVAEKQPQYAKVAAKQIQPKYSLTRIMFNGKYQEFYSLNQVADPNTLKGELILCRSKRNYDYVVGTLKVIIPAQYKQDKAIAGIEFIDSLGNSNGEFSGKHYFQTKKFCAVFLPITEVYMSYKQQMM
ncbi:hypothetical protein LOD99_13573 [Oopsacas minuta]|uniref:CAP-Gly domain-containing protein n=1 Tax=Oopsacas minuta TaxID=111878 RepID=A0AAV7KKH4_9METZ|nr:hypothetical protein LOD99_13573 [Oopsacas minuta]